MASSANRLRAALAALALLGAAAPAAADVVCRIGGGGSLAFGPYDLLSPAPTDTLGTVTVLCERNGGPRNMTVDMQLGPGVHGRSVQDRRLGHTGGSGDTLDYNLFRDVSRSDVWGFRSGVDTVAQPDEIDNKDSATLVFRVYGRIPALQEGAVGNYADSVQITISP